MHAWETIDQSLNYIEEHLSGEISTEELADMVGLSQFSENRSRSMRNPGKQISIQHMAASAQPHYRTIFGRKVFPGCRRYGVYGNLGETVAA